MDAHESSRLDVCVNFSRVYGGVSEEELHRPQICAALEQMRGEGMPEGVRGDAATNACVLGVALDQLPYSLTS